MSGLGYRAFKAALELTQGRRYRGMMMAARDPRAAQEAVLARILTANAETEFGREYGFSRIAGMREYRRAAPVHTYEDLRDAIERQELAGDKCLTEEPPVYYHRTSGTVGAPKNIPVTASGLAQMKRDQRLSAYVWARHSGVMESKVFGIGGAAVEGWMPGGTPYGSASGVLYRSQSRFVRSRYVLPPEVSEIEDYGARYLTMAVYGLSERGVTGIATANPSTFLRLLGVVHDNADTVLYAISTGRLPDSSGRLSLTARPERARELSRRLEAAGRLTYADIWPDLRGIVTWTGGSCGIALGNLAPLLPEGVRIIEWGYSSSEFRGTLNVDIRRNACLPTFMNTVFEFVEREEWEADGGEFLGLDELEEGREYYVFVTTEDGLYRYDINDIVRVNGWVEATPTLAFVQKGKGVTNITGEKVTESQVLEAVTSVFAASGSTPQFFIMLADEVAAGYRLYVETGSATNDGAEAADIDRRLSALNIEYESKRQSGRLAMLEVRRLPPGSGDLYRESCVASGQRDAQFKYLHLQYARDCSFDFDTIPGVV